MPPTTEPLAPVLYSVIPNRGHRARRRGGHAARRQPLQRLRARSPRQCLGAPTVTFNVDGVRRAPGDCPELRARRHQAASSSRPSISPNPVLATPTRASRVTNPKGSATLGNGFTFLGEARRSRDLLDLAQQGQRPRRRHRHHLRQVLPARRCRCEFGAGRLAPRSSRSSADKTAITVKVPAASIQPARRWTPCPTSP